MTQPALPPVHGHDELRAALVRAVAARELPDSLLLHGPPGVGRQRLGLWLAQLLVCSEPVEDGPCGACRPCRLALGLQHPDIHWFFPVARPKGNLSGERLADALEEIRAETLESLRRDPCRPAAAGGDALAFYLAQVRTMRRVAHARPAMGSRKVFLLGDAERLVPQEGSEEAANALLKLLEEPPPQTTIILTAREPDAILPTLRSRLLPLRLRPLAEDQVERFLTGVRRADPAGARTAARLGQGSIGRALGFLPQNGQPAPLDSLRADARALLAAALDPGPTRRFAAALDLAPSGARGAFRDTLEFVGLWIRDLAAAAAGAEERVVNQDALDFLRAAAARLPAAAAGAPAAILAVEDARALAAGNVNPQLTTARMLHGIRSALNGEALA